MTIGTYDITLVENATKQLLVTFPGVVSVTGWSAAASVRSADSPTATLLGSFTTALTSDGANLIITLTLDETTVDSIATHIGKGNRAFWSLKLTKPDASTTQIIKGSLTLVRTVTA
jgi:hypothetical protein